MYLRFQKTVSHCHKPDQPLSRQQYSHILQFQIFSVIDQNIMSHTMDSTEGDAKMIWQVFPERFLARYDDLVHEIKDTHRILYTSRRVLMEIQGSINELIDQILIELQKLKSD